jgi:RNA polymerase sigma factor (sigma-70 family)
MCRADWSGVFAGRTFTPLDPAVLAAAEQNEAGVRKVLCVVIQRLREPYRTVIRQRFIDDLSLSEIAGTVNVPVRTVRHVLSRAIDQLRKELNQHFAGSVT